MIVTVLDSNIFISGFLFNGKQRSIINHAIEGHFKIFISSAIISEIENVLIRQKFKLTKNHVSLLIKEIEFLCEICYPKEATIDVCRDSKDHIILECAIESNSDYIVTGDDDLLTLGQYKSIKIINSETFLEIIENKAVFT